MKNLNIVQQSESDSGESDAIMEIESDVKNNALKQYYELPSIIQKRVKALKNLQLDAIKIEEKFYKELGNLEERFAAQYQAIYNKRNDIIIGAREPTDLEAAYKSEGESDNEYDDENDDENDLSAEKGIPRFWLMVLQNSDIIRYTIQEIDIELLAHLIDIKCITKNGEENGFVLEFFFSKNEYFSNEKLTKQYIVDASIPNECPFQYEGPRIIRTIGCQINWNQGKNITTKTVKKVQKSKNRSEKKTLTKVIKVDSFFNFFDPPTQSIEDDEELATDIGEMLAADFEMAEYIRERIIKRAVLYYTGEECRDDCEGEYDDEDYDEDESD